MKPKTPPLEQAYLNWIEDHDLFNRRQREGIAKEFAAIARQFGAGDDYDIRPVKREATDERA